jgi:cobalt transporter subunit CbtB
MVTTTPAVLDMERVEQSSRLRVGVSSNAILAALSAFALGFTMLFVVGFSHSDLIHAAAHDVRHSAGFPCH